MRLKLLLPSKVLFDETVQKVVAHGKEGSFGILPRHIDFVASLAPGVLLFVDGDGREQFVGTDESILVKCGDEVLVSTLGAVRGDDLESLQTAVREQFLSLDERERATRQALGRLEAGVVRRLIEYRGEV